MKGKGEDSGKDDYQISSLVLWMYGGAVPETRETGTGYVCGVQEFGLGCIELEGLWSNILGS